MLYFVFVIKKKRGYVVRPSVCTLTLPCFRNKPAVLPVARGLPSFFSFFFVFSPSWIELALRPHPRRRERWPRGRHSRRKASRRMLRIIPALPQPPRLVSPCLSPSPPTAGPPYIWGAVSRSGASPMTAVTLEDAAQVFVWRLCAMVHCGGGPAGELG
jgi:hypothetical protein